MSALTARPVCDCCDKPVARVYFSDGAFGETYACLACKGDPVGFAEDEAEALEVAS